VDTRLERIILSLVKQYAPQLLGSTSSLGSKREERLERLCRRLANEGVLVLACEVMGMAGNPALIQTQNWVSSVARMHSVLARRLFPTYARLDIQYVDNEMPAVVVATGDSNILMQKMAGFVLPYLAARHMQVASEAELRGLIDILFDELEAGDLPRTDQQTLRAECVLLLQRLLSSPVRLLALRTFDRPIFFGVQDTPTNGMQPIVPPPTLPPDTPPAPKGVSQTMPAVEIKRTTGSFAIIQPERPQNLPETGKLSAPPKTATQEQKALKLEATKQENENVVPSNAKIEPTKQEKGNSIPRNPTPIARNETGTNRQPPVPPLPGGKK
jgi:hypothetical protein